MTILSRIKQEILKPAKRKKVKTLGHELGVIGKKTELWFGKYKGLIVKDILKENPGYIVWLMDNTTLVFDKEVQEKARKKKLKADAEWNYRHRKMDVGGNRWRGAIGDWDHWGNGDHDGEWYDSWEGICGDPWDPKGPW